MRSRDLLRVAFLGAVVPALNLVAVATPPPSPEAMAAARVRHDPARDLTPISRELGLADITCTARPGQFDDVQCMITLKDEARARFVTMHKTPGAQEDRYECRVMTRQPVATYTIWGNKRVAGTQEAIGSTPSERFTAPIEPKLPTPDWAKGAVWYQIFPERFRNGNPSNDPNGSGVFLAKWASNWYAVQPGEMEARAARLGRVSDNRQRAAETRDDLYKVIFDRRYGGDLQGVVEKLDDLKDLGVTAIYLNPIFQARSMHKYDASDYRHIDSALGNPPPPPEDGTSGTSLAIDETYYTPPAGETDDPKTWTWTPADRYFVDVFIPAVHKHGMRVILDGVWNHTGREFWAFEDVQKKGKASACADWYKATFDEAGKLAGWSGWDHQKNGYLPEFRQVRGASAGRDWDQSVEKGDLAPGPKEHIFAITKRWMDPNGDGDPSDGIDGWRLDVVPWVGAEFWRSWRQHVKAINAEAILVCEVWEDADRYMQGDEFDTQMHYPFAFPTLDWLGNKTGKGEAFGAAQLAAALGPAFDNAPQTNLIHQNLFASHDTDRYASMLFNPGRGYDRDNNVQNGDGVKHGYKPGKPDEHAFKLSLVGVAIQATYLGAPMVYYGDEVGMWGADDPTCRKPYPWVDAGTMENNDDNADPAIRTEYRRWLRLRQDPAAGEVLRYGSVRHLGAGSSDVFAFERALNGVRVIVAANRSDATVILPLGLVPGVENATVGALSARAWTLTGEGAAQALAE